MKKTISVIVAIAMMLMVSIPAFAGNFDDNADLTAQQKVFAEVIFDGLNAGNNTADTLANYVGSNLDYKADVTSPATITDDVSEAFDAANEKLTVPFTDEALINSMKLRTSAPLPAAIRLLTAKVHQTSALAAAAATCSISFSPISQTAISATSSRASLIRSLR